MPMMRSGGLGQFRRHGFPSLAGGFQGDALIRQPANIIDAGDDALGGFVAIGMGGVEQATEYRIATKHDPLISDGVGLF